MPTSLGPAEILVILVLALIVLGPKRLPEAGRQVGRFVSEVRHWSSAVQTEIRDAIDIEGEPPPPPPTAAPNLPPAPAPPPVPTPADLGAQSPPAGSEGAGHPVSSAEWGLAAPSPEPPPSPESPPEPLNEPTPEAAPSATTALPAEWSTPPPNSEN